VHFRLYRANWILYSDRIFALIEYGAVLIIVHSDSADIIKELTFMHQYNSYSIVQDPAVQIFTSNVISVDKGLHTF
jgi:hypothetical protein